MTAVTKISALKLKDHSRSSRSYHNRHDIMGTFTWTCARTYNFSHLSRTIIRYSINVVRCVIKKGPLSITPFLGLPCHSRPPDFLSCRYFKGGPEPLEKEIHKILGSKREDRFSDPFLKLVQKISGSFVRTSSLL